MIDRYSVWGKGLLKVKGLRGWMCNEKREKKSNREGEGWGINKSKLHGNIKKKTERKWEISMVTLKVSVNQENDSV